MKNIYLTFGKTNPYHASIHKHKTGGKPTFVNSYEYCTKETMWNMLAGWLQEESDSIVWNDNGGLSDTDMNPPEDLLAPGEYRWSHDIWSYWAKEISELDENEINLALSSAVVPSDIKAEIMKLHNIPEEEEY
jgi:hypothetical protein